MVELFFLIALQIFLVILGLPLVFNKIPPNKFYGLRTEATLADEKLWFAKNHRAGRASVCIGILTIVALLLASLWTSSSFLLVVITIGSGFIYVVSAANIVLSGDR
ncbi:MAG: SdpI family protein [Sphingobacteriales bacterium]|nr:MAG: SdpI family protein [Sphingobacteriales bacterium]